MVCGMSQMSALVVMTLAVTMMTWGGAMAQSGCTSALMGLAPCLGFIQGGSSTPSSSCCSGLSKVVQTQAACLCQVLNGGGSSFGVTINQTRALALPDACKVRTPSASQCNAVNKPATSPAGSPVGSPAGSAADALTPEGSESNAPTISTTPTDGFGSKSSTKTGSTSDGIITKFPLHFTLLTLLFITYACYY